MTVREHIISKLMNLASGGLTTFKTSDIQELAYIGKHDFGKFLGSSETYTREFRRMRTDGVLKVRKLDRKNRQQIWELREIQTNFPNDVV
jgi:hypothetical protein|tara:strand:- start:823 stop:1092 length:270 start_codon:yes stop_codon:yes gene_type:complete